MEQRKEQIKVGSKVDTEVLEFRNIGSGIYLVYPKGAVVEEVERVGDIVPDEKLGYYFWSYQRLVPAQLLEVAAKIKELLAKGE